MQALAAIACTGAGPSKLLGAQGQFRCRLTGIVPVHKDWYGDPVKLLSGNLLVHGEVLTDFMMIMFFIICWPTQDLPNLVNK